MINKKIIKSMALALTFSLSLGLFTNIQTTEVKAFEAVGGDNFGTGTGAPKGESSGFYSNYPTGVFRFIPVRNRPDSRLVHVHMRNGVDTPPDAFKRDVTTVLTKALTDQSDIGMDRKIYFKRVRWQDRSEFIRGDYNSVGVYKPEPDPGSPYFYKNTFYNINNQVPYYGTTPNFFVGRQYSRRLQDYLAVLKDVKTGKSMAEVCKNEPYVYMLSFENNDTLALRRKLTPNSKDNVIIVPVYDGNGTNRFKNYKQNYLGGYAAISNSFIDWSDIYPAGTSNSTLQWAKNPMEFITSFPDYYKGTGGLTKKDGNNKPIIVFCKASATEQPPEPKFNHKPCNTAYPNVPTSGIVEDNILSTKEGQFFKGIYEYKMTITPTHPMDLNNTSPTFRKDYNDTHQFQTTGVIKTAFGRYLDELKANETIERLRNLPYDQAKAQFDAINEKLQTLKVQADNEAKTNLSLSEANKRGLSGGSVLEVSSDVKYGTIQTNLGLNTNNQVITKCVEDKIPTIDYEYSYDPKYCTRNEGGYCGFDRISARIVNEIKQIETVDSNNTNAIINTAFSSTFTPFMFYQLIGVKCSSANTVKAQLGQTGGIILSQTDLSVLGQTRIQYGTTVRQYSNFAVGFLYNDKCFSSICTAAKTPNQPTDIDINSNYTNDGKLSNSAIAKDPSGKDVISSKFDFFRDGSGKLVKASIFYPNITSPNAKVSRSVAGLWQLQDNSTPTVDSKQLTIQNGMGQKLFEKNGDFKTTMGFNLNKFNFSAIWASEKDKPVVITGAYGYKLDFVSATVSNAKADGTNPSVIPTVHPVAATCPFNPNPSEPTIFNGPKYYDPNMKPFFDDTAGKASFSTQFNKSSAE